MAVSRERREAAAAAAAAKKKNRRRVLRSPHSPPPLLRPPLSLSLSLSSSSLSTSPSSPSTSKPATDETFLLLLVVTGKRGPKRDQGFSKSRKVGRKKRERERKRDFFSSRASTTTALRFDERQCAASGATKNQSSATSRSDRSRRLNDRSLNANKGRERKYSRRLSRSEFRAATKVSPPVAPFSNKK